jgi:hypothetical protein
MLEHGKCMHFYRIMLSEIQYCGYTWASHAVIFFGIKGNSTETARSRKALLGKYTKLTSILCLSKAASFPATL